MKRNRIGIIHLILAAMLIPLGLITPGVAIAQPSAGYECILDTEDNGTADDDEDTDAGADANNTGSNLACGSSATAGPDGDNTALGSGAQAGIGAMIQDENTAVGSDAMAGIGDGSEENTAVGYHSSAGIGANADNNTAIGGDAVAGDGDTANFNTALGEGARAGVGLDADSNTSLGESSEAGIGENADENTAVGEAAQAGIGDGNSRNTALGDGALANAFGSDGTMEATAVGAGAEANFDRSAAFGADAVATRANQMVYGTETETHTMPGVTSAASRAAQSGPLELVTTDAMGNLASDQGEFFGRIRANADDIDDNSEGIAMAMSIRNPDLVGDERLGMNVSWGTFRGEHAMGMALSGVLVPDIGAGIRLGMAGGAAFGLDRGGIGGTAGFQLSW